MQLEDTYRLVVKLCGVHSSIAYGRRVDIPNSEVPGAREEFLGFTAEVLAPGA